MKHVEARPYAKSEAAARKLVELAAGIEPIQDGRIHRRSTRRFSIHLRPLGASSGRASSRRSSAAGSSFTRAAPMCGS